MRHDKQWFLDRIGERVFRDSDGCDCSMCVNTVDSGVVISDALHANYLFDCQNELGLNYYDQKPNNT